MNAEKPFIPVRVRPCPLSDRDKVSFTKSTPYTHRCIRITVMARLIWGCYPYSTPKLTASKSIQHWYISNSDLFLMNQKTPEAIKKAVQDIRQNARPSIDCIDSSITDEEILAIFAICEVYEAIDNIQQGKPEGATKEKVLSASMFLNLARTGFEPEKQTLASTPKVIPFPTPSGTQWHEVKVSFIDNENVEISIKGKVTTKNYAEMGFKNRSKPSILWTFFRQIAQAGGSFAGYSDENKVKIKELFSDLRKKLTSYFQIEGDPIPYTKGEGYRTSFILENKSYSLENEDSIRKQNARYVPPKNKHTRRNGYKEDSDHDMT